MRRFLAFAALLVAGALYTLVALPASGDRGVGVTLSAVDIPHSLTRGAGYDLPTLGVVNTGSEPADFEVVVSYEDDRTLLRPGQAWFDFQPRRFSLDAGESQSVTIHLSLPANASSGDYFAYLEAHPVSDGSAGIVGPAAATKLSFSVKPSSWLAAQRLRFNRLLDDNQPWTWLLPALALGCIAFWTARRYLPYRIRSPFERR